VDCAFTISGFDLEWDLQGEEGLPRATDAEVVNHGHQHQYSQTENGKSKEI
jgi:predicted phosphodiesterase